MTILEKILRLIAGRSTVTNRIVQAAPGTLEETLLLKNFPHIEKIPHAVRLVLVQEALRRAAENESDGVARMGEFLDQIDSLADNVIAVFNGDENADPRILNILVFHKVQIAPDAK